MMQFATCCKNTAMEFLKKGCPNKDISPEKLPKLCEGLKDDIVRITDPEFHGLAIVVGKNFKPSDQGRFDEITDEVLSL